MIEEHRAPSSHYTCPRSVDDVGWSVSMTFPIGRQQAARSGCLAFVII
ncbi:MAG: hypothetical protein OJF50_002283 [Nitrospira sp.]|nr:hypothetical protein [Nitrospira sp.]